MANLSSYVGTGLQALGGALPALVGGVPGALAGGASNVIGSLINQYANTPNASSMQQSNMAQQPMQQPGGDPQQLRQGPNNTMLYERFNPQERSALDKILQTGLAGLQQQSQGFAPIREAANLNFREQTLPQILERIQGMTGGQRGSGRDQLLALAGRGFESDLSSQEAQYNQNQNQLLQNLLGIGLTPRQDVIYQGRQPGFWESLGTAGLVGAGSALPGLLKSGGTSLIDLIKSLSQARQEEQAAEQSPAVQAGARPDQNEAFQQILEQLRYSLPQFAPQSQLGRL